MAVNQALANSIPSEWLLWEGMRVEKHKHLHLYHEAGRVGLHTVSHAEVGEDPIHAAAAVEGGGDQGADLRQDHNQCHLPQTIHSMMSFSVLPWPHCSVYFSHRSLVLFATIAPMCSALYTPNCCLDLF